MIWELLFAYLGILVGFALARIAKEELVSGKRYFLLLKKILFIAVVLTSIYSLFSGADYLWLTILIILSLLVLLLQNPRISIITKLGYWIEIMNYLLFTLFYLLIDPKLQIIILSLIFIYGFPLGSLLMIDIFMRKSKDGLQSYDTKTKKRRKK